MRSFFALLLSRLKKLFAFILRKNEPTPADGGPGDDFFIDRPINDDDVYVCYYGCPNSKKAQKLQLSRKLYR
ncbi:MAG: hypothetical protein IKN72_12420 [Clostridia bacterium]|nr:hypothetical protein [Clostridia bacterium]